MSKRAKIDTSSLRKSFDILYYPAPNSLINSTPSIITVWDLAHRLFPFFPEVSYTGWRWRDRECLYQDALKRAAYVIVGTEAGKDQVRRFYGVDTSRTLPPPGDLSSILPLEWPFSESFIFYPAQFWPHKNHAYLLQALSILRARGREIGLVLSGSDKGNREYVESLVTRLKLQHQVFFAGFVSDEGMSTLYREAAALVFPSLFGPDNLPPLEAMASGCPAVVADVEGAREQLSDAALYFDPLRPDTIADAISIVIEDSETKHKLIERGSNLVRRRAPDAYVRSLNLIIDEFRLFKRMWSQTYVHL
jgi:glycosyltransferase involved in cell wall biosynthesis